MAGLRDDLGFLLAWVSGEVVRAANASLAPEGLRVRQYSVLQLARDFPDGVSQRQLARELGLDPSQIVSLVDELAAAGLVERRPAATDRRTRLVTATEAGERKLAYAAELAADGVRDALKALSEDEQETLRALLARVACPPPDAAESRAR